MQGFRHIHHWQRALLIHNTVAIRMSFTTVWSRPLWNMTLGTPIGTIRLALILTTLLWLHVKQVDTSSSQFKRIDSQDTQNLDSDIQALPSGGSQISHSIDPNGKEPKVKVIPNANAPDSLPRSGSVKANITIITESKFLSSDSKCHIESNNGYLIIHSGASSCVVDTFYGKYNMKVSDLMYTVFYGPVQVICGRCRGSFMAREVCISGGRLITNEEGTCEAETPWVHIVVLSLSVGLSLIAIYSLRYLWLRRMWSPEDHCLFSSAGGVMSFTQKYVNIGKQGLLDYKMCPTDTSPLPSSGATYKSVQVTRTQVILIVLLFLSPHRILKVEGAFSTFYTTQGDVIRTGLGYVHVNEAHHHHSLQERYKTAPWDWVLNIDYWCTPSGCNSNGNCISYNPTGNWTTNYYWKHSKTSKDNWVYKRYCTIPGPNCVFSNGCWKWDVRYRFGDENIFKVSSMIDSLPVVNLGVVHDTESEIVSTHFGESFPIGSHSIVTSPDYQDYLCPFSHNHKIPLAGQLGDIQIGSDELVTIADDTSICSVSFISGPQCQIMESFIRNLETYCVKLPARYGSFLVERSRGGIITRKDSNLILTISHQTNVTISLYDTGCNISSEGIVGVKGGLLPYQYHVKTTITSPGSHLKITIPCTDITEHIPCDGLVHVFSMPSLSECKGNRPNMKINEIIEEDMNLLKKSHAEAFSFESVGLDIWTKFKNQTPFLLSWTYAGVPVVLYAFLIIILLFKILK